MMAILIYLISTLILIGISDAKPKPRIFGGNFAKENQFPYQAAILRYGRLECGATIIDEYFILTAAHCVIGEYSKKVFNPKELKILVGTNNLNDKYAERYQVKSIYNHTEYNDDRNDIAIIQVEKPIKFSKSVQPIKLFDEEFSSDMDIIISGWGQNEHGFLLPYLKFNKLKGNIQPKCGDEVLDYYGGFICIEHKENNGMCFGDSGGPAVVNGKLIGVANIVIFECGTTKPDVYAYIPFYLDWIKEHTVRK